MNEELYHEISKFYESDFIAGFSHHKMSSLVRNVMVN